MRNFNRLILGFFIFFIVFGLMLFPAIAWSQDSEKTIAIRENSFQTDWPLIRAQRPFKIKAVIENEGNTPFQCRLIVPEDVTVSEKADVSTDKDGFASILTWNAVCRSPGQLEMSLELTAQDRVIQKTTISQKVLPPRTMERLDYIPEPEPVKTKLLIGAHNCPLWETDRAELWNQVVQKHQERTPALGIYSQDNPEIADWETKWAVEHGVSYFIYCWYRTSQGGPVTTMFEQSIFDDALFKSRFCNQMKFTIMWENQRRGIAGIADMNDLTENLMPYWIDKFFKRDNYLKIDNKPVLFIYRPEEVATDLGGEDKAKIAFDTMREMCKNAGFDGLYLLGEYRGTDPAVLTQYKNMGLDYTFAYCWYVHYPPDSQTIIDTQLDFLRKTQEMHDIIPQVATLSQAWSGWQDEGSIWKLPPNDFEKLLRQGKEFVETNIAKTELGGRMMILDNWNEWSEGHYIAPYREYGFDYLDAVRRVFSDAPEKHDDLIPQDIGLGPYDIPAFAATPEQADTDRKAGERMTLNIKDVEYAFRWCPAETFMMGSPAGERGRPNDEEKQHQVMLTQGFWMLETPVTQEMWEGVTGSNPSYFKGSGKLPVEQVSWDDCRDYIRKLNALGVAPPNYKFSLPTEAQWEYACRAGTTTPFSFGSILNGDKANCDGNYPYGTETAGPNLENTTEVCSYPANAWGLYDMHGNVWEWCSDWFGIYPSDSETDPEGLLTGPGRVIRGGSWSYYARNCRSAYRSYSEPSRRDISVGVRLSLVRDE